MSNKQIIKSALPWVGSNSVGDMVDETGSYTDMLGDHIGALDSLSPEKTVLEDGSPSYGYDAGILSPVDGEDWEMYWDDGGVFMEPKKASLRLLSMLDKGDSVLDVGTGDGRHANFMAERGLSVTGIDLSETAAKKSDGLSNEFVSVYGDIKYYKFGQKFDGFQALSVLEYIDEPILAIRNIYSQLKPKAYGVVHTRDSLMSQESARSMFADAGFNILRENKFSISDEPYHEFFLEKHDLDKTAFVCISLITQDGVCPVSRKFVHPKDRNISATHNDIKYHFSSDANFKKFSLNPDRYTDSKIYLSCDVAKDRGDKIAGLQVYPRIKSGAGLLFPYKRPTDVIYHMGSVRYPIDILFIDEKNIIKKIYKNIAPGSLATFGAASIKNVLEIAGGMSDRLGIFCGNYIDISHGSQEPANIKSLRHVISGGNGEGGIVKVSSIVSGGAYRFNGFNIVEVNNRNNVGAGPSRALSKFAGLSIGKKRKAHVFCLDDMLEDSYIRLFSTEDQSRGCRVLSKKLISSDLSFISENSLSFKRGPGGSYVELPGSDLDGEFKDIFRKIIRTSKSKSNKIIFATKYTKNKEYVMEIILNKIEDSLGIYKSSIDSEIISVSNYSSDEIFKAIYNSYGDSSPYVYMPELKLYKSSSGSISEDVTSKAKEALSYFAKSSEKIESILQNLNKNLEEYNKFDGNAEVVRSSMGQYNESVKRNKKIIEDGLTNMLNGIRIMNKIKDISTTMELIDSMASSAKVATDYIQEVFDLVKAIDSEEFLMLLKDKTGNCENSVKDCLETIKRMKSYINKDILGIVVISD
tara:strand:+ start:81322 stop:83745 length:2424 start_codon:yes stop_codon:yes gene_type:complete